MAGNAAGAVKTAAARLGLSEREYREHLARGGKWCGACRAWQPRGDFTSDTRRGDGLEPICKEARQQRSRERYKPRARPGPGRRFVPARRHDKKQARRRINHLVATGLLPRPNELPCCDCGHIGEDRRHEYDHFLGYAPEHHELVQAVCSRCHRRRAIARGEWGTARR